MHDRMPGPKALSESSILEDVKVRDELQEQYKKVVETQEQKNKED